MKLSVFCGVSVDGFLARPNHALDFLRTGEQEPHGFEEFYRKRRCRCYRAQDLRSRVDIRQMVFTARSRWSC